MKKLTNGAQKIGLHLSARQVEQFATYYQELVAWNQKMNLTAITDYEEVQTKHFLDALTVTLALKQPVDNARIIDVGTGAGIPGLPLKIAFPNTGLVLLDSTAKKATFLRHIVSILGLENVEVVVGRAEEVAHLPEYREKFDVVLSRAVAALPALVELTLPFATLGGCVVAQKKMGIDQEISQAAKAIGILGGKLREIMPIELEGLLEKRQLIIIDKISATPPQYPRRPGIPAKRPLNYSG